LYANLPLALEGLIVGISSQGFDEGETKKVLVSKEE
jgi:hypothetical protein